MSLPLADRVALVTGASRGVGRGIAQELGAAGATVFVTGRAQRPPTDTLPGTVEEAAHLVTRAGGRGIPVLCDHTKDTDVRALMDRVRDEAGQLDLLVNNVWGAYEQYDPKLSSMPAWEQPLWRWDRMFEAGVRAHYVTSRAALPLLLRSERPLIINISAGDRGRFLGDVQYDVAKAALDRLAFALARRHRADGLVALTLHPGFTRTERLEAAFTDPHSPRFVGRAVVAVATAPDPARWSDGAYRAVELGRELRFTAVNGKETEPA